jgi:hypothetical protein
MDEAGVSCMSGPYSINLPAGLLPFKKTWFFFHDFKLAIILYTFFSLD